MAGLSLALAGVASCTNKETVSPAEEPCATVATVRFCYGRTIGCLTQHTTLELADGTSLRPSGPVWDAYLSKQLDGQLLRISYTVVPRLTNDAPGYENATLECLEENIGRCGTR